MAVEFANDTMKRAGALYTDWPENIIIMPELNGRHEHTDIEALAADIAAHNQLQPVGIRKNDQGQPVLIYGHRRYRAVCLLNERNPEQRRKIFCTYTPVTDAEAFGMAIRENRCRKDVSPIDDCANIRTLENKFGYTYEDIAAVYFPEAQTEAEKAEALRFVKQRAALVELAPEAAQAVRDGRVKLTAAVGLAKLTKDQQRAKVSGNGHVKVSDVKASHNHRNGTQPKTNELAPEVQTSPSPAPQPVNGKAKHTPKAQTAMCAEVMAVMIDLMSDVALNELNDEKVKRVSVDKELLLKLASFMVTEDEAKAVQGDVAF